MHFFAFLVRSPAGLLLTYIMETWIGRVASKALLSMVVLKFLNAHCDYCFGRKGAMLFGNLQIGWGWGMYDQLKFMSKMQNLISCWYYQVRTVNLVQQTQWYLSFFGFILFSFSFLFFFFSAFWNLYFTRSSVQYVGPAGGWNVYSTQPISLLVPCILARDPAAGVTRSISLFFYMDYYLLFTNILQFIMGAGASFLQDLQFTTTIHGQSILILLSNWKLSDFFFFFFFFVFFNLYIYLIS